MYNCGDTLGDATSYYSSCFYGMYGILIMIKSCDICCRCSTSCCKKKIIGHHPNASLCFWKPWKCTLLAVIVPSSLWLKNRVFVLGPNSTKWKIVSYIITMSIWLSLFINIALNRFLIGILYYEQERSN